MAYVEGLKPDHGKVLIGNPEEGMLTCRNANQMGIDWTLSSYVPLGQGYIVDTDKLTLTIDGRLVAKGSEEAADALMADAIEVQRNEDNDKEAPHG